MRVVQGIEVVSELVIFWHRRDLRLHDNVGLAEARQHSPRVIGVFCFDPAILEQDDIAPARVKYLLACLQELQQHYETVGSQLLLLQGNPTEILPQIAHKLNVHTVYWNLDVEPYAQQRDHEMATQLRAVGIKIETCWDQLLHQPGKVLTQSKKPYSVYTPFWNNWSQQTKLQPVKNLENCQGLTTQELKKINNHLIDLPSLSDLGLCWEQPFTVPVGESESLAKLAEFSEKSIETYDGDRNFPAIEGTSRLSAALKFGAIGIRTVWQATTQALDHCRSEEAQTGITTWQQELAWREFYQHCLFFFPELAKGSYREPFKDFPWDNDQETFQAWCTGQTGYPIIDAAMRQLNETGWMHNRCRMIVASFLTKDLIINWQWGEKYFMQTLVDGDLAANNGGWQWSASSGMDPKPLRIFNPYTQAKKYDPEAEYIRTWVPELRSLETDELLSGDISSASRKQHNYPEAIVNHNQQQREFKRRYKETKDNT